MIGGIRAAVPYGPAVGTDAPGVFAARLAGERGNHRRPVQARANTSDREPIATSPSHGCPSEGGSDAATRWNPADEVFASVPGPPLESLARPGDGRRPERRRSSRPAPPVRQAVRL